MSQNWHMHGRFWTQPQLQTLMETLLESTADESGAHTQQTDCSTSAAVAQTETSMQNAFAIITVCVFAALRISEHDGRTVEKQLAPRKQSNLIFNDPFALY